MEAFHDESETFRKAVVLKVTDGSQYTVRFPDGDERIVRRNGVTLMGPTHFNEGSSLSEFPLTDPVSFGTPVTASGGARKRRRVTENGSAESSPESAPRPSEGESSETAGAAGAAGSDSSPNGMDASGSCPDGREEAPPPTGTHHEVVLINPSRDGLDTGQLWWPALVVPAAEVMREMIGANDVDHKYQFVVRFFEDNLYAIIEQQYIKTLKRGTNPFEHFCDSPKFLVRSLPHDAAPAAQSSLRRRNGLTWCGCSLAPTGCGSCPRVFGRGQTSERLSVEDVLGQV